jgi:hypothetical protein
VVRSPEATCGIANISLLIEAGFKVLRVLTARPSECAQKASGHIWEGIGPLIELRWQFFSRWECTSFVSKRCTYKPFINNSLVELDGLKSCAMGR